MIISVCNDDQDVDRIGRHSARHDSATFGAFYPVGRTPPQLGAAENLFIIGHGAHRNAGDGANPVIGNRGRGITLNGVELVEHLLGLPNGLTGGVNVFPNGYTGNLYVYACETADFADGALSLAEVVTNTLQSALNNDSVAFGQSGSVDCSWLPGPNDHSWRSGFL
ncbi:MAG: hypothetical protein M3340_11545 [Actinomycetota bacterium]|nr:hypothetical protein [Actinomycetota bacterium]